MSILQLQLSEGFLWPPSPEDSGFEGIGDLALCDKDYYTSFLKNNFISIVPFIYLHSIMLFLVKITKDESNMIEDKVIVFQPEHNLAT